MIDCRIGVTVRSELAAEVWTIIAAVRMLMATLDRPMVEPTLSRVVERLGGMIAEQEPETLQRILKCYRCLYQTQTKRYLMRHITRVHKKKADVKRKDSISA